MTDKNADRLEAVCVAVVFGVLIGALHDSWPRGVFAFAAMFCLSRWPDRWRRRHLSILRRQGLHRAGAPRAGPSAPPSSAACPRMISTKVSP